MVRVRCYMFRMLQSSVVALTFGPSDLTFATTPSRKLQCTVPAVGNLFLYSSLHVSDHASACGMAVASTFLMAAVAVVCACVCVIVCACDCVRTRACVSACACARNVCARVCMCVCVRVLARARVRGVCVHAYYYSVRARHSCVCARVHA